jgi:hypothetical protein
MIARPAARRRPLFASLVLLVPIGCGNEGEGASAPDAATTPPAAKSAATVVPYAYPAPVKGHYEEVNTGDFDLVDGLAYTSSSGAGTVVYVTSKPIASPALASSSCPMTEARAIGLLRDAAYLEVTLDAAGRSSYFAQGTPRGGRGREEDVGGKYWTIEKKKTAAARVAGSFAYRGRGSFEFDMPIEVPRVAEVSEGERVQGHRAPADAPTPEGSAVLDLYRALHAAAKARDLAAFLAAQGFSRDLIGAIRGLAGIDDDFAAFADRFLDPGDPGEATVYEGYGGVRATGVNSRGEAYSNYYEFAPAEGRLVLVGLSEDEQ